MNIGEVLEYSVEGIFEEDEDASREGVEALSRAMSELSRKVHNGEDIDIEPSRVHTYVFE
ncbi:hypothetical protein ACMGT0_20355 [Pseudomonas sp. RHF3.3-3]|uniref:Uncharacterized protein n=1 Tax=Pseudomonas asplenii TaxID=53407 RepID=A0A0M9GG23_9PSED|nr:hypothetical protein [Pseudomonas fuscovaginae]KPA90364.1 hypothetical protein PF66_03172 [Pseudomonas fuscovaginae]